ncbi:MULTISPECIES: hypothetical protein [unclassified Carboxylicivirga]|uniref:hypothetical protein n=1 Tax=Carboxylicivirga TaxID=1628153 RepID=UPI003D34F846
MGSRKEEIINMISGGWPGAAFKDLAHEFHQSPHDIQLLFELNEHPTHRIAWRSAYLLDTIHDINRDSLRNYLEVIIERCPRLTNESIKRHYLRILAQYDLSKLADGRLLDCCFQWLQTAETPIAVKAHCMQILYGLCAHYPELIPELKAVLTGLLPYASKGEANRAKKILSQLNASIER